MLVQSRLRWLLVVGLLGCLALSAPLWVPRSDLPLFPLLPTSQGLALLINLVGLALFVGSLSFILRFPSRRLGFVGLVVSLGLLVVTDLTRWQPWLYHFALTSLLLAVFSGEPDRDFKLEWFSLWLLVAVYVWSGWHKLHLDSGQSIVLVLVATFPAKWQTVLWSQWGAVLGVVAGALELLFGVLLCFGRTRRVAVVCLAIMHLWIVVSLVTMGHDICVIPWNLYCVGLLVWVAWPSRRSLWVLPWRVLCEGSPTPSTTSQSVPAKGMALVWVGLLGIVPLLHTWSWTGANASFALYSGNYVYTQLLIPRNVFHRLPKAVLPYASPVVRVPLRKALKREEQWVSLHMVDLHSWSMRRFGTTVPPTRFFFSQVHRTLCRRFHDRPFLLVVRGKKVWGRGSKVFDVRSCAWRWQRSKWPASPP
ncbi:MAG: hypothetical protein EP343_27240 [Deltaproteobacteria bacterium]|nr:MAG: hypothetical protein EP343_27240 [Deltaproteobacteria bacterium]